MIIQRPGQKIHFVPGIGINIVTPMSAAATPWWLSGGISAADVAGVWQAKGAASLAASYLRLAGNEGNANIDPAVIGVGVAPTWNTIDGWVGNGLAWLDTGIVPVENSLLIVRFTNANDETNQAGCYSTTNASWRFGVRAKQNAIPPLSSRYWGGSLSASGIDGTSFNNGIISLYNQHGYRNTTIDSAAMTHTLAYYSIAILGVKSGAGTAIFKTSSNIQAVFIGKPGISLVQFQALVTAIAAL